MKIQVKYLSGSGNLFTVLDNRNLKIGFGQLSASAPALCNSPAFKTEGLLVIDSSSAGNDFSVLFFNPDGSSGMMCGNGGRCAMSFALSEGFVDSGKENDMLSFDMLGTVYKGKVNGSTARLYFPPPKEIRKSIDININGINYQGDYLDVGSDHFVIRYDIIKEFAGEDFECFDIEKFAKPIRFHQYFSRRGANINFYQKINGSTLRIRTYERGVEAETGACGTGAIATSLSAWLSGLILKPVTLYPTSKKPLIVNFETEKAGNIESLYLEGEIETLGSESIYLTF